jgi:hypothetical protein
MSIKDMLGNLKKLATEKVATEDYVDKKYEEIHLELSRMKIKLHDSDITAVLESREITKEEFMDIICDIKDTLVNLKDSEYTMDLILDAIDKKRNKKNKSNKQKPQRPNTNYNNEIEVDFKDTNKDTGKLKPGSRKRLNALLSLVNPNDATTPTELQVKYIFDIEIDVLKAPKFIGTTKDDARKYITKYVKMHDDWKAENNIKNTFKRLIIEDDIQVKRGVGYNGR